jgi:hypothetical protein
MARLNGAGGGTRTRSLPREGLGFRDRYVYQVPPRPRQMPKRGAVEAAPRRVRGGPRIYNILSRQLLTPESCLNPRCGCQGKELRYLRYLQVKSYFAGQSDAGSLASTARISLSCVGLHRGSFSFHQVTIERVFQVFFAALASISSVTFIPQSRPLRLKMAKSSLRSSLTERFSEGRAISITDCF